MTCFNTWISVTGTRPTIIRTCFELWLAPSEEILVLTSISSLSELNMATKNDLYELNFFCSLLTDSLSVLNIGSKHHFRQRINSCLGALPCLLNMSSKHVLRQVMKFVCFVLTYSHSVLNMVSKLEVGQLKKFGYSRST